MRNGNDNTVMSWDSFFPYWRHDAWQKFKLVNLALLCIIFTTAALFAIGFSQEITLWGSCVISISTVLLGFWRGKRQKKRHNEVKLSESASSLISRKFLSGYMQHIVRSHPLENIQQFHEEPLFEKNFLGMSPLSKGNKARPAAALPHVNHPKKKQADQMQALFRPLSCSHFLGQESNTWILESIQEAAPRENRFALPQLFVLRSAQMPLKDFNPRNTRKDTIELLVH